MAEFGKNLKAALMRGMEAISNTATNIASNTRYKVSEMNLLNRKEEILAAFGNKAYELYQKGETFPEELTKQLEELVALDAELVKLHAEHIANTEVEKKAEPEEPAAEAIEAEVVVEAEPEIVEAEVDAEAEPEIAEAEAVIEAAPEMTEAEPNFTEEAPQAEDITSTFDL